MITEIEQVKSLTTHKHVKIYKLSQLGLTHKAIAEALGTNVGHVYNVLKDYASKPEKAEKSNAIA